MTREELVWSRLPGDGQLLVLLLPQMLGSAVIDPLFRAHLPLQCQAVPGPQSLCCENNPRTCLWASDVGSHRRCVTNWCPHVHPSQSKVRDTGRHRQCRLWGRGDGSNGCR